MPHLSEALLSRRGKVWGKGQGAGGVDSGLPLIGELNRLQENVLLLFTDAQERGAQFLFVIGGNVISGKSMWAGRRIAQLIRRPETLNGLGKAGQRSSALLLPLGE